MNAKEFYNFLCSIVQPGTRSTPNYSSESDYPVEVVQLLDGCQHHTEMDPKRFVNQYEIHKDAMPDHAERWGRLQLLTPVFNWRETSRMDYEQGVKLLYILVWIDKEWIGLRCRTVET